MSLDYRRATGDVPEFDVAVGLQKCPDLFDLFFEGRGRGFGRILGSDPHVKGMIHQNGKAELSDYPIGLSDSQHGASTSYTFDRDLRDDERFTLL